MQANIRKFAHSLFIGSAMELSESFDVKEAKVKLSNPQAAAKEICAKLAKLGSKRVAFCMLLPGNRAFYLVLKPHHCLLRNAYRTKRGVRR